MVEPNAEIRIWVIPIVATRNAVVDLNAVAEPNAEVRIAATRCVQVVVIQTATGDFLNEAALAVVQVVARDVVIQSAVTRCVQVVVTRFAVQCVQDAVLCVRDAVIQFVVIRCVRDAMGVLQDEAPKAHSAGVLDVQGVVLVVHLNLDGVHAAVARVPGLSQVAVPVPA
jgi:hypothetical protein